MDLNNYEAFYFETYKTKEKRIQAAKRLGERGLLITPGNEPIGKLIFKLKTRNQKKDEKTKTSPLS